MLGIAILLAAMPAPPPQLLAGAAFERFAGKTDALCPARRLRSITPGDLDAVQEDFVAQIGPRARRRLAAANTADRRCADRNGLACPTTATLAAMAKTRLLASFVAFACSSRSP